MYVCYLFMCFLYTEETLGGNYENYFRNPNQYLHSIEILSLN
jgi:hypothetical protein